MSRIDLVSKNLLANFFAIVAKEIIEKKLCQKITYKYCKDRKNYKSNKNQDLEKKRSLEGPRNVRKYRKNRKNNKSNKNQDLEREEANKGPEMSLNIAKIAKVTRIFLAS